MALPLCSIQEAEWVAIQNLKVAQHVTINRGLGSFRRWASAHPACLVQGRQLFSRGSDFVGRDFSLR